MTTPLPQSIIWSVCHLGEPDEAQHLAEGDVGLGRAQQRAADEERRARDHEIELVRKESAAGFNRDAEERLSRLLAQYPETERFGGRVQSLGGNVYHVCRGSVLELEGKKYLCFGGAESPDREEREPGVNWWNEAYAFA